MKLRISLKQLNDTSVQYLAGCYICPPFKVSSDKFFHFLMSKMNWRGVLSLFETHLPPPIQCFNHHLIIDNKPCCIRQVVESIFPSRPRFYIGYQAAAQYISNLSFLKLKHFNVLILPSTPYAQQYAKILTWHWLERSIDNVVFLKG